MTAASPTAETGVEKRVVAPSRKTTVPVGRPAVVLATWVVRVGAGAMVRVAGATVWVSFGGDVDGYAVCGAGGVLQGGDAEEDCGDGGEWNPALEYLREQERIAEAKRMEGSRWVGLVNVGIGIGLMVMVRALRADGAYLVGMIPLVHGYWQGPKAKG